MFWGKHRKLQNHFVPIGKYATKCDKDGNKSIHILKNKTCW